MLLGSCGRNVVFGQNVVAPPSAQDCTSATTSSSTTTACSTRRASPIAASASATASSSGATRFFRARTATSSSSDGANIGFNCEIFSASSVRIGRERADGRLQLRDWRRPRLLRLRRRACSSSRGPRRACRSATVRGLARARRFSTASRSAITRSSAPAPWFAKTYRRTRLPSGFRRAWCPKPRRHTDGGIELFDGVPLRSRSTRR